MAEKENVVNDTQQTVVVSDKGSSVKGAAKDGTPSFADNAQISERAQSRTENSRQRRLRLENESYKKEVEKLKGELSCLSELESLKAQNKVYLEKLVKDKMDKDLELLKKQDPEITTLASLGDNFIKLIENGVDVSVAYNAVKSAEVQKPLPPQMGAVGEGSYGSRYFTSKELDRLTAKDLENPKIFKKAMESLKRL